MGYTELPASVLQLQEQLVGQEDVNPIQTMTIIIMETGFVHIMVVLAATVVDLVESLDLY